MVEANDKDDEIRDLLSWLRSRLGQNFVVIDHWEADRSAIGVAATDDPKQLVYIASRGQPAGPYFVELETHRVGDPISRTQRLADSRPLTENSYYESPPSI